MRYIEESEFSQMLPSLGISPGEDDRELSMSDDGVMGFDFTNLQSPEKDSYYETIMAGDRSVEYVMVSTIVRVLDSLGLFPIYLYAIDNEWLDEEITPLVAKKMLTKEEATILTEIQNEGRGMDAIVIDHESIQQAVRILVPQMTVFSTRCYLIDGKGKALVSISADDEISFDTADQAIYQKARNMLKSLESLPFDIIWAEDYS